MTTKYIDVLNNDFEKKKALEAVPEIKVPTISFEDEQSFIKFLRYDLKIENYGNILPILLNQGYNATLFFCSKKSFS